jgi:tetratricopeptide (TPR) repeat protein
VPVIISTVASNLRDWPPAPLPYPAGLTATQIQQLSGSIAEAEQKLDHRDPGVELALNRIPLFPSYALLDFLRGRARDLQGRRDQAREYYLRALREDAGLDRAPPEINAIIRELARQSGSALLDAEQLFAEHTASSAPGFDLFMDHVHPNLFGQALIAQALLHLIQSGAFPFSAGAWQPAPEITEAEIIRAFDLAPDYLAEVYFRIGLFCGLQKRLPERNAWTLGALEKAGKLRPQDPLPALCQALVYLNQGETASALGNFGALLQEQPEKTARAISWYLPNIASFEGNLLRLSLPSDPLRPPLLGLLSNLPGTGGPQVPAGQSLGSNNYYFEWRPAEKKMIELKGPVR